MNPSQPNDQPSQPAQDPMKPVAYDQDGNPLYAHPPQQIPPESLNKPPVSEAEAQRRVAAGDTSPQVVYMTRAVDPHQQDISPDIKEKHEESKKKYSQLNLSDGEFVITSIKRHPIGLLSIWAVVIAAVLIIFIGFPILLNSERFFGPDGLPAGAVMSGGITLLLAATLFILGGVIATVVYNANRFYLTNESVIQHIQTSLFSKKDQIISLASIEDASYRQLGILQTLLNYGSIRLSTEGEETTYRFNFVANPKKEVDRLNNAVEAFKNYRPVDGED